MMRKWMCGLAAALLLSVSASVIAQEEMADASPPPPEATIISDQQSLARLRASNGITLQWISWDYRGTVDVSDRGDVIHLSGVQHDRESDAYVSVDGDIVEVGSDYFILNGRIVIHDTPDRGRHCEKTGFSRFAITQNRQYWRLREFEWCDGLTDYIDIYF